MSQFASECKKCKASIAWNGTVAEFLEMDAKWSATHPCFREDDDAEESR